MSNDEVKTVMAIAWNDDLLLFPSRRFLSPSPGEARSSLALGQGTVSRRSRTWRSCKRKIELREGSLVFLIELEYKTHWIGPHASQGVEMLSIGDFRFSVLVPLSPSPGNLKQADTSYQEQERHPAFVNGWAESGPHLLRLWEQGTSVSLTAGMWRNVCSSLRISLLFLCLSCDTYV